MNIQAIFNTKFPAYCIGTLFLLLQATSLLAQNNDPNMGIIPAPFSVTKTEGTFTFSQLTQIKADDPEDRSVLLLRDFLLNNQHFNNKLSRYNPKARLSRNSTTLILTAIGSETLPEEGYKLISEPGKIMIIGKGAGLFYGIQSFMQLFPVASQGSVELPCFIIEDHPRFRHRGMMLDVARHFFTVAQVKKVIDIMSSYKLNNFHWHLTDGQGWRIEIKRYPKLTEVGGTRMQTSFGGNRDWPDEVPYSGFYTQDEIRDVVQYASERFINIIPEIEMPAHSDAALRAYPELKCIPAPGSANPNRGNSIYCPTEETFTFLEGVLTEVMTLFPSKYIHIGGDEANKQPWIESRYSQDLMKRLNLKNEHELQSYFIQRMEKFINSKGRSIIGWDEILEGGVAPNATVMSWQGEQGGITAAQQKHDVIMSPQTNGMYLDHYYSRNSQEPVSFPRYASLADTYNYDPVSKALSPEEQKYVIGVQGNLWTEYVPTFSKLQFQIFPRLFALSEVAWSKTENKDYKQFTETRLAKHFGRLEALNYNFRVPPPFEVIDTMLIGSKFTFSSQSVIPGAKIYYTLNGRNPSDTDWEYLSPVTLTVPENEKREFRAIVISPNGRRSLASRTLIYNRAPLAAIDTQGREQGVNFKLFRGSFVVPQQLDQAVADSTGAAQDLDNEQLRRSNPNFGLIYEAYVSIPSDGIYNFSLSSFTDAAMWIDDQRLIQNEESVPLKKGYHRIRINYIYHAPQAPPAGSGFRMPRVNPLRVYLSEAGDARKEIDPGSLFLVN